MNQVKTGRFIAEMRKEKGLTQRQLADYLNLSDKTISKWETGHGMPEVSLMMPLCVHLDISVNELIAGERLTQAEYKKKAEEYIMGSVREKEEIRKKMILSALICFVITLAAATIIIVAGGLTMPLWARFMLVGIGLIIVSGGIALAAILDM